MNYKVHALAGAAVAGAICRTVPLNEPCKTMVCLGMVAGSIIPDIDSSLSRVSSLGYITDSVSVLVEHIFGHRGFFHTPAFVVILCCIWYTVQNGLIGDGNLVAGIVMSSLGFSFILGYALHIFVDLFNEYGIMLLYPLSDKRFHFKHTIRMGGMSEYRLKAVLRLICVWLLICPVGLAKYTEFMNCAISNFIIKHGLYYVIQ